METECSAEFNISVKLCLCFPTCSRKNLRGDVFVSVGLSHMTYAF